MSQNGERVTLDKFGNNQIIKGMKNKKNEDFPECYVELKGQLYKISVSQAKKEGVLMWCTITQLKKKNLSM